MHWEAIQGVVTRHQLSPTYHWLIHWLITYSSTNFWKNTDSSLSYHRLINDSSHWFSPTHHRLNTDSTSVNWMTVNVNNLCKGRKRCELRCWVTLVPLNIKMLYYYTHGSWLTNKHTIERTSGQMWVYKSQICVIMITITTNSNY